MKLLSLEPFIPSGKEFERSKQLFQALGFKMNWDAGDYVGFERDGCKFILQRYNNDEFAQNLMISVGIDSAQEFAAFIKEEEIAEKFGVRVGSITDQPYGKEINMIDIAGVCWHFVEQ